MWSQCKEWFIKHAQGTSGKWWLGLFSFTESIFLPVPTDTFMMVILLAGDNVKRWFYYATLTMITSVIGAIVGYFIAFWLFDSFGPSLIVFYGMQDAFAQAQVQYGQSVFLFTFIGAISPIPYKIFVLTAGFMKVNLLTFIIASIVGRASRLYLSAWLIYRYGERGVAIAGRYARHLLIIGMGVLAAYALGYMWL